LKENVEPERTTCTMDLTSKRNSVTSTTTPKVHTPEPRKFWLQNSGTKTAGHTRSQTPNMTSFSINNPHPQNVHFENERISIRVRPSNTSLEQHPISSNVGKTERAPKYFNLDENQFRELLKEFEVGLSVHKKLNTNTSSGLKPPSYNQNMSMTMRITSGSGLGLDKNNEVKGYGKRLLRLNLSGKSIEVIKLTGPGGMRKTLEYVYLWKDLKKLFVPPQTLKQARDQLNESVSSNEMLQFSLDVVEKGRIDFLNSNPWHLAIIWNVVNQILTQGRVIL